MTALVEIRQVSKVYERGKQKVEALHRVDLDIEAGAFVALMGPSGSGKSTLLNLIGGLDVPSSGSVMVDGQRIDRLSEDALARWRAGHVGFVFQFYNLLPMLTARRNVELPLLLTRLSAAQRRRNAEVALQLVGLGDRDRPTSRMSSRADSSNASRSREPSFRIRRCWCATSRPVISTGNRPQRSRAYCSSSTAVTARPSSWSRTIRRRPSMRSAPCTWTRARWRSRSRC